MLAVGDHVAHVEVVRHDLRVIQEHEAQLQDLARRGVHAAQEDPLVAHVSVPHVEQLANRPAHERGDLLRGVHVRVDRDLDPALVRPTSDRVVAGQHLVLEEVLGDAHQTLRRDPDVADVLDVEQAEQPVLEALDRHVSHVAARNHDVADGRRSPQVLEHRVPALVLLHLEPVLQDLERVVADQVHARAVAAVLRARRDQLGEHLGRVSVREALDRPHVGLVQRVARRHRVGGELGVAVRERRRHVAAHGVAPQIRLVHRVDHLRRDQHRHRGALTLVALDVPVQVVGEEVPERALELDEVLHRVRPLPLGGLPLLDRHVPIAGQSRPVRLDEPAPQRVLERLLGRVGAAHLPLGADVRRGHLLGHGITPPPGTVPPGTGRCGGRMVLPVRDMIPVVLPPEAPSRRTTFGG